MYVHLPAVLRVGYSDYHHTRYIGQHTKISKTFDKHKSFESFFIPHPSAFAGAPPAFTHRSNPRNVCYHIELVDGKFSHALSTFINTVLSGNSSFDTS
jgi:hypothetical protein